MNHVSSVKDKFHFLESLPAFTFLWNIQHISLCDGGVSTKEMPYTRAEPQEIRQISHRSRLHGPGCTEFCSSGFLSLLV